MWILKCDSSESDHVFYLTPEKKEIVVGRIPISGALVVENDSSISRKHCSLHIAKQENCPSAVTTKTGIWAVDLGSKYGTYVKLTDGFQKLDPNKPFILPHGSLIRFGIIKSVWSVEYKPIVLLFNSTINRDLQLDLRTKMGSIGGDVMTVCDHRTSYLVANSYSLSEKILLALIYGIPLVTPAFICELLCAIKDNKPFPDPRNFKPELKEMAVRLEDLILEPGCNRKDLFKGLRFFVTCPNRQRSLKPIVEAAGGSINIYDEKHKSQLLDTGVIVLETFIKLESSQLSQATSEIKGYLERHGKRTVPVQEIPLAIAYNSIDRLCNENSAEFTIKSASQPVICSQSTLIEECTEIPKKVIEGYGIIECTSVEDTQNLVDHIENEDNRQSRTPLVTESGLTDSNIYSNPSALNKNITISSNLKNSIAVTTESSSQRTSQKRVGSLDIFDNSNPKKRLLSQTSTGKISITSNIFQTPVTESTRIESPNEDMVPNSSQESISSSIRQSFDINEYENPFGKRKAVPESQSTPAKKSRPSSKAEDKNSDLLCNKTTNKNTSTAGHIFATPVAPNKIQPTAPTSATRTVIDTTPCKDSEGWIDMSHRKDGDKTPGEAMSATIVMLSLVNLAQPLKPDDDDSDCPKNVKVFKKQILPYFNRTVDLQSIPDHFDEFAV